MENNVLNRMVELLDNEKYDYVEVLGFNPSTGDLGSDFTRLSAEDKKYLSWEVRYIMPLHSDGKDILRIEIENRSK